MKPNYTQSQQQSSEPVEIVDGDYAMKVDSNLNVYVRNLRTQTQFVKIGKCPKAGLSKAQKEVFLHQTMDEMYKCMEQEKQLDDDKSY